jgi:hypothetical protein
VVLVTAPDRLARNFVHQMVVLEELERRGVRVVFIDRPCSDDPHEQLVTQIRGAVAEYERTLIADRMRRGRQARLRSGQLLPWTRAPYGYRLHPERPRGPGCGRGRPGRRRRGAGAVCRVRGRWGDPAHPGRAVDGAAGADPDRQADLAVDDNPQSVDQSGLQGSGSQRSAAHRPGPPPLVGAGTSRQGRQHPGPPAPGVDHRRGAGAGGGRAVRPGRPAAGRQPAGCPA